MVCGFILSTVLEWPLAIALLIGVFLVFGIPIWIYESRDKRKKYRAAFGGREPLDEQAFYESHFQTRGVPVDVVVKVKRVLEDVLNDDLSRLRAEDDFNHNLSFFFQYDSMASLEIVERLEEEFSISISNEEASEHIASPRLLTWYGSSYVNGPHNSRLYSELSFAFPDPRLSA